MIQKVMVRFKKGLWNLGQQVADAIFVLKSPIGLHNAAVIIHGASCAGKTTVLRKLKRRYNGCSYREADQFAYWKHGSAEYDPRLLGEVQTALVACGVEGGEG